MNGAGTFDNCMNLDTATAFALIWRQSLCLVRPRIEIGANAGGA